MSHDLYAPGGGPTLPTSDEGPTVAAVGPQESKRDITRDFQGAPGAAQATWMINGDEKAAQCLARSPARQADPAEPMPSVPILLGLASRGLLRAIGKTLGVRRG